jgi:hypothetical protein
MAPSKSHEDAITVIKSIIKDEFKVKDSGFVTRESGYFNGLFPDLAFREPLTNLWVVIEVGNTNAEKIEKYLSMKHINEIRWYTKLRHDEGVKLVGQWFHDGNFGTRVSARACGLRKREREITEELTILESELLDKRLYKDSYACCAGCGAHTQIKYIRVMGYRGRHYAVCQQCKEKGNFTTINSFRDAVFQTIDENRKRFNERCADEIVGVN